jgi:hypothetical protein
VIFNSYVRLFFSHCLRGSSEKGLQEPLEDIIEEDANANAYLLRGLPKLTEWDCE